MLTHAIKNSYLVLTLSVPWQLGLAQGAPQPAPAPAPVPSNNVTELDSSTSQALEAFMKEKPGEGTAAKATADLASALADKLKAMDVLKTPGLDDPAVRARFETYLSLKEVPQARIDEYFGKMKQVSDTLKAGDTFGAWKILYSMSQYEDLDAGISRELAARVENFWNTGRTKYGLEKDNTKFRDDAAIATHNADLDAHELQEEEEEQRQKASKGSSSASTSTNSSSTTNSPLLNPNADPIAAEAELMPTMGQALQGKMDMTAEYLNLLEARAKIKLNEIRENKMSDADRLDFSDYIQTLYRTHRYYHVIIAADFYRALFNEGDYPSDLANQAVAGAAGNARTAADSAHLVIKTLGVNAGGPASMLNQFGGAMGGDTMGAPDQPMSIADEVTSALEINERVSQAIEVFKYKAGQSEIAAAANELQEAFVGNEFHPALQGLAREDKQKVGDFLDKLDVLKHQLEVRAFEQVDAQIADIKKIASDFDATEPLAMVNDIKFESSMKIGQARLQAQAGDNKGAFETFTTAGELWPGNPDLHSSAKMYLTTEDAGNQATADFDRLVQEQNYRGIFDRQIEFAVAVRDDATRKQQLTDAITKVEKAKVAEEKANMLVLNGDVDGAWETIELAAKDWPDDTTLNKLLADLTGRSADFVSAINKARDAEGKKEFGYSLTWYVTAQSSYPPSQIANEGIDRVSKLILSPQATTTTAAAN